MPLLAPVTSILPTPMPPDWASRPRPARPAEPGAPDRRWPRWTRLSIDRKPPAKKDQVALWRELRRHGALKLDAGTWAVGHAPDGSMPLDRAIELIDATGGRASWTEADGADEDRALRQACRRVWTDLHVDVDQLEEDAALGDLEPAAAWEEADRLRSAYADGCRRDLVGIDARRAAGRLGEVLSAVAASFGAPPADSVRVLGDRRFGRLPAVTTGTARRDGTARHVVQLRALPPWRWEQELAAFEARCYLPAPDRPTLVHGVALLLVEPDALGPSLSRLADRLALFEASITA